MFIKLKSTGGETLYINTYSIKFFSKFNHSDFTFIEMLDSQTMQVKETPEEILNLIKGNYLNV